MSLVPSLLRCVPGAARSLFRFDASATLALLLGWLLLCTATEDGQAQTDGFWQVYLYANEVRDVVAVGEDIFAATSGGAVLWTEDGFQQWTRRPLGVLSDSLRTVARDRSGNVWFGTERVGISILNPGNERWEPYTSLLEPIPGNRVRRVRIQEDSEGREVLLVAGEQGYSWFVDGDLRVPCQQGVDICDLPSYDILDLLLVEDELWIATAQGLVIQHSDGSWEPRSTPGPVDLLAPDGGAVLAASGRSVLRWSDDAWVEVGVDLPVGIEATDLLATDGGDVWLAAQGSQGGVFRFQGSGWDRVGTQVFPATSVAMTGSGRVVAGASDVNERLDGIWEWRDGTWIQRKVPGPSLRSYYRSARMGEDEVLWFSAAQSGRAPLVGSWDGETWTIRNGGQAGALRSWTWSTLEAGGLVYLAHCCCNPSEQLCRLEFLDEEGDFGAFPDIREIWSLAFDDDGYLWGGTNNGDESLATGVYRIDPITREWQLFDRERVGFPSNQIPSVRVIDRVAWVGTFGDGLVRWDFGANGEPEGDPDVVPGSDDVIRVYNTSDGIQGEQLIGNSIRQIEVGSDGRIWVGTTSGVSIYENGVFTNIGPRFDGLPNGEITAIVLDGAGGAWVGTRDSGLTRMRSDPRGGFLYSNYRTPLLPNPNVDALALSPDGRTVWCGTSRGLASFTPFQGAGDSGTAGNVAAYPNPFVLGCSDGLRLRGGGGLLSGVVVDLGGKILSRFDYVSAEDLVWDVTVGGEPAAPGLYIVRVQGPNGVSSVGVAVLDGDCPR